MKNDNKFQSLSRNEMKEITGGETSAALQGPKCGDRCNPMDSVCKWNRECVYCTYDPFGPGGATSYSCSFWA